MIVMTKDKHHELQDPLDYKCVTFNPKNHSDLTQWLIHLKVSIYVF